MYWDFYESNDVVTRKKHHCHLCEIDIRPKTKCFYEKGKWDGEMVSRWSHSECAKKWSDINKSQQNDEWYMFDDWDDDIFNFTDWKKYINSKYDFIETNIEPTSGS